MARGLDNRLAKLEAQLSAHLNARNAPMSAAEWNAGITPRAMKARQEHAERIRAWEDRRTAYELLSIADKLAHHKRELAELEQRYERATREHRVGVSENPMANVLSAYADPKWHAYRRRLIEIRIMELEGESEEITTRETMLAHATFSGNGPSGLEEAQFFERFKVPYREGSEPPRSPDRPAEPEPVENDMDISDLIAPEKPLRKPSTRRAPEPHKPAPRAPDRLDGFRAREVNEETLAYFEPNG